MERNRNKRILIGVTHHTSLTFHEDLARELQDRGHELHLVSSMGFDHQRLALEFQTHIVDMQRNPHLSQDVRSLYRWIKLVKDIKPDLVLLGTPKASLLGMIAAKLANVEHRIYWVHGLRLETTVGFKRFVFLKLEQLTAKMSTLMYAVSPSLKQSLVELGIAPQSKVKILGKGSTQGVDLSIFHPISDENRKNEFLSILGLKPDRFTIGFVGRLTAEKGVNELKEALESLRKENRDFQLLILGSIEDQMGVSFLDGLRAAGIDHVSTGHVKDSAPYYRVMDLFCLPTYREGLPNVILEAFASNVPVVSTEVTGVVDLIQDGKNGLLVAPRDPESLKRAIAKIMDDGSLANELVEHAYRVAIGDFDKKRVVMAQANLVDVLLEE